LDWVTVTMRSSVLRGSPRISWFDGRRFEGGPGIGKGCSQPKRFKTVYVTQSRPHLDLRFGRCLDPFVSMHSWHG
jgi:hypothetical protein